MKMKQYYDLLKELDQKKQSIELLNEKCKRMQTELNNRQELNQKIKDEEGIQE